MKTELLPLNLSFVFECNLLLLNILCVELLKRFCPTTQFTVVKRASGSDVRAETALIRIKNG